MSDSDTDQLGFETAAKGEEQEKKDIESDPRDEVRVNTQDTLICLNSVRLFSITELPLDELKNCTTLELRKNLIHQLVPLPAALRAQLQELDLFDNKIKHVAPFFSSAANSPLFADRRWTSVYPGVTDCSYAALRKLDLSYNQIKRVTGLESLGDTLEELYLVENCIKAIEGLSALRKLKVLELGGNQIRAVEPNSLQGLASLEQLWLGKNKIATLGAACFGAHCPKLRRISLQANRLTSVEPGVFPAGQLLELRELYLSENGLHCIQNISHLHSVTLFDFSFNPIASLMLASEASSSSPSAAGAASSGGDDKNNTGPGEQVEEKQSKKKEDDEPKEPEKAVAAAAAAAPVVTQKKEGESDGSASGENNVTSVSDATAAVAASPAMTSSSSSNSIINTELTVENFPLLEEFWLTDGALDDWKELALFVPFSKTLRTIYLERNPLERDRRYRDKVYQQMPFVTQIDSWPVVNKTNPEADRAIHRR